MLQLKDIGYQNGLKNNNNKTHIYAAYKRLILDLKTPPDWKWGDGEPSVMLMDFKRKPE